MCIQWVVGVCPQLPDVLSSLFEIDLDKSPVTNVGLGRAVHAITVFESTTKHTASTSPPDGGGLYFPPVTIYVVPSHLPQAPLVLRLDPSSTIAV